MEILSLVLGVLIIVAAFIIWNLMRKVERLEDIVEDQVGYLQNISYLISTSREEVDKLDASGHFQADDELGVFFEYIKQIQDTADNYILPPEYGKKEE